MPHRLMFRPPLFTQPMLPPHRFFAPLALALVLLPVAVQAAPPPNDNFANRIVLNGQAVSSGPITIDEATREGLEPVATQEQTLWWTWTAPQDGIVTINTQGTTRYNYLRVFNGSNLANLALIKQGDGDAARINFPVKAGLVYQISIGFSSSDRGSATLNLQNGPTNITAPVVVGVPALTNDNFANAVTLIGPVVSGFTYSTGATREGQEPAFTGDQTVWWTWTAPADSQVTMTTAGSNAFTYLSVFNGDRLSELHTVARSGANSATVRFPAKAGFVYHMAVGLNRSVGSPVVGDVPVLNVITAPLSITSPVIIGSQANANDNYSGAQSLGSNQTVSGFGFNQDATVESLESRNTGSRTLWWTWTAPVSGKLGFTAQGTDFNHVLSLFTGDTIGSATFLGAARNSGSQAAFAQPSDVTAGTTYHIAIGGTSGGEAGTAVLNLNFAPSGTAVTIAADGTAGATEGGAKGAFIVTRVGSLAGPLTVAYKVGGTAIGGVEYKTLPGLVTLPAGVVSVRIKVKAINDNVDNGTTTVKAALLPGNGYSIGTPASAKLKIHDND